MRRKVYTLLAMLTMVTLFALQLHAGRNRETSCWRGYVFSIEACSGPSENINMRIDAAWDAYLACSVEQGLGRLFL